VLTNHKVSVAWQIVFTFIPIANFWAFYRIRKLRKYALYVIVPEIILTSVLLWYYFASIPRFSSLGDDGLAFGSSPEINQVQIISSVVGWGLQGFSIYLIIIWSRRHNKRFDQPTSQSAAPAG
jgi:hypothetical protein